MNQLFEPNRVSLYLEDAPLSKSVSGRGLTVVNAALVQCFPEGTNVFLAQMHASHPKEKWDAQIAPRIFPLSNLRKQLIRFTEIYAPALACTTKRLVFRGFVKKIQDNNVHTLFAIIGADFQSVIRAFTLSIQSGSQLALYFVDDLLAAAAAKCVSQTEINRIEAQLRAALEHSSRIFCVTAALADLFIEKFGVAAHVLPLPYEINREKATDSSRNNTIVHIGAVNHIYVDGLIATARVMERLNSQGLDLILSLTSTPHPSIRDILESHVKLCITEFETKDLLKAHLRGSLCAVVPTLYEPSGMYRTSFPSKLLEYLDACRTIVAFGPAESSSVRYMTENNLQFSARSEAELELVLLGVASTRPDNSCSYRRALVNTNSVPTVRNKVFSQLGISGSVR